MWNILIWILLFIGGYLLIYFAADIFLDNLKELCLICKLSPFIIGLLVLGIDPEESIASIIAAINGLPFITIGNIIGNSIFSLTLCFALPAFFYNITLKSISRFYFEILYICMIFLLLSFFVEYGLLLFGLAALILYIIYIIKSIRDISKKGVLDTVEIKDIAEELKEQKVEFSKGSIVKRIIMIIIGLFFIILGGEILIYSAEILINLTGISEEIFGFLIIAFVTNVEELTLVFKSIKKGSFEIGLGGMMGKVIWNLSLTFGLGGLIAVQIGFNQILTYNWLLLLGLIVYYHVKSKKENLGKFDASILMIFLIVFIIINLIFN
ncbi:MAG: sodium:calcium antiporter [Promethearchaeota archaeon]